MITNTQTNKIFIPNLQTNTPDIEALVSISPDLLPGAVVPAAHPIGKAHIRGRDIEPARPLTTDHRKIHHTVVSVIDSQDRYPRPLLTARSHPVESEVDLFLIGRGFFLKMYS